MLQNFNDLKTKFAKNYSQFLINLISLTYKLKFSYELKNFRKVLNQNYYVELSSNVRDIFNYTNKKVIEQFLLNPHEGEAFKLNSTCIEESPSLLYRNNYEFDEKLEFKFVKNNKNDKEVNLEIWYDSMLVNSVKLEDNGITKLYYDDVFGKPKFSPDGKKIVFIAEEDFSKKYKNYFGLIKEEEEGSNEDKSKFNDEDSLEKNLTKFEYKQDFGEGLKDKHSPVIFIYDIEKNKFQKLNLEISETKIYPSHPVFDYNSNDIVFCGYDMPDLKLGLLFCLKRKSAIYLVKDPIWEDTKKSDKKQEKSEEMSKNNDSSNSKKNKLINLSPKDYTNIYPIFSPNYKHLLWFSNEKSTPHMNGLRLYSLDWESKKNLDLNNNSAYNTLESKLLIDKINSDNDFFNGIYSYEDSISQLNFLTDNLFIFNSQHKNTDCIFIYDISSNRIMKVDPVLSSQKVISVKKRENMIFTLNSDVNILPHAKVIAFNQENYSEIKEDEFYFEKLENGATYIKPKENISNSIFKSTVLTTINKELFTVLKGSPVMNNVKELNEYLEGILNDIQVDDLKLNDVYGHFIYQKNRDYKVRNDGWKTPIVYVLHGGPNSLFEKFFSMAQLLFLAHGYSVLVVNYPGSVGFGQKYLSSLSGNIGKLDIDSVGEFLNSFLNSEKYSDFIDRNNVMLYGGSHGGFLSCWLMSHPKYCKMFASSAIRNPVTDLVSFMANTDIPDWVIGQSTDLDLYENYPPSKENSDKLYDASPIYSAKNCVTPALFMIGQSDKRVSCSNGLYFYEVIRKNKCETKLLLYPDDGHPLSSPETDIDCIFNICKWFEKHLKH